LLAEAARRRLQAACNEKKRFLTRAVAGRDMGVLPDKTERKVQINVLYWFRHKDRKGFRLQP
jgi:hypothetical protein